MYRRWLWLFAATAALLVIAGCGRVDLEDLTKPADRTAQAAAAATRAAAPTATSRPVSGSPGSGSPSADEPSIQAGKTLYNYWCSGCHDNGRNGAGPVRGNSYDPDATLLMLRGDPTAAKQHPTKYTVHDMTDDMIRNVVAFLASGE